MQSKRFLIFVAGTLLLAGCASWDGNFEICGYTTKPMYDLTIRSVRVPIFGNRTLKKNLEFQLTEAVIREIQSKTPYKVVRDRGRADTELIGTIITWTKNVVNINQLGENRQAETVLAVELVWRDLRDANKNQLLSKETKAGEAPIINVPGSPAAPVLVQAKGSYAPEIGESNATADNDTCNKLAVTIVSLMEKPW